MISLTLDPIALRFYYSIPFGSTPSERTEGTSYVGSSGYTGLSFPIPLNFSGATIVGAILHIANLNVNGVGYSGSGDIVGQGARTVLGIPANTTDFYNQNTESGPLTNAKRYIKDDVYEGTADYEIDSSYVGAIDVTDMLQEAVNAGYILGGSIQIVWRLDSDMLFTYAQSGNEFVLDIDYLPQNNILDDWTLVSSGNFTFSASTNSTLEDWSLSTQAINSLTTSAVLTRTLENWSIASTASSVTDAGVLQQVLDNWTLSSSGIISDGAEAVLTLDDWSLNSQASSTLSGQVDLGLDNWSIDSQSTLGASALAVSIIPLSDWSLSSQSVIGNGAILNSLLANWTVTATGELSSKTSNDLLPDSLLPNSLYAGAGF